MIIKNRSKKRTKKAKAENEPGSMTCFPGKRGAREKCNRFTDLKGRYRYSFGVRNSDFGFIFSNKVGNFQQDLLTLMENNI